MNCRTRWHDEFPVCVNHPAAVDVLVSGAGRAGIPVQFLPDPLRPSEDFSHLSALFPAAYAVLGAGDTPPLHNEFYDFPDDLIDIGVNLFESIVRERLG